MVFLGNGQGGVRYFLEATSPNPVFRPQGNRLLVDLDQEVTKLELASFSGFGGRTTEFAIVDPGISVTKLVGVARDPAQLVANDGALDFLRNDLLENEHIDTFRGSAFDDVIEFKDAPTIIRGFSGDDEISVGPGASRIVAGRGDDVVTATGADLVVKGGPGDDTLSGGGAAETLNGGGGADSVRGKGGDDRLLGQGGDDVLKGQGGDDTLSGGGGDDFLNGGGGADRLEGGDGADTVKGGGGDDVIVFSPRDDGDDIILGFQSGRDVVELSGAGSFSAGGLVIEAGVTGAVARIGDGSLTFQGLAVTEIDASDFIF